MSLERVDLTKRKKTFGLVISQLNQNLLDVYTSNKNYADNEDFRYLPQVQQQSLKQKSQQDISKKPEVQNPVVQQQPVITQSVEEKKQPPAKRIQTVSKQVNSWKKAETRQRLNVDNSPTKLIAARHRITALQAEYAKDLKWWEKTFFGLFKHLFSSRYQRKQAKHDEMLTLSLCIDFAALSIAAGDALQKPLVTCGFFSKSEELLDTIVNHSDKLLPVEEKKEQPSYACTYEEPQIWKMDF